MGKLKSALGENLYSCILYGSAARGNALPKISDINILIVLEESTPSAHSAIAEAIRDSIHVEPFILGRALLNRSMQAFATKFLSIRRNYRILHGADPLADLKLDEPLARFLCEQSVRNLRLRLVRAYVVFGNDRKKYTRFLSRMTGTLFTSLGEALRRTGIDVPAEFDARISLFERVFEVEATVLKELLGLKEASRQLTANDIPGFHARLFRLVDRAVHWMEGQWPPLR